MADKNNKMEKYIKLYFSYGPIDMIQKMKADGIRTAMTLEVHNSKDCHEFTELKDHIAQFFKDNQSVKLRPILFNPIACRV